MSSLQEIQHLFIFRNLRLRQGPQQAQDLSPVTQCPTGQLAYDKGVAEYLLLIEQRPQPLTSFAKMLNPNRCIDQNHAGRLARRLRIGRSPFSVPPSSAKRRALSFDIKASRPRRTREVFSLIPVSLAAWRNKESSMLSVVLICINMHLSCIQVKLGIGEITRRGRLRPAPR